VGVYFASSDMKVKHIAYAFECGIGIANITVNVVTPGAAGQEDPRATALDLCGGSNNSDRSIN
jgi:hypothetical protein